MSELNTSEHLIDYHSQEGVKASVDLSSVSTVPNFLSLTYLGPKGNLALKVIAEVAEGVLGIFILSFLVVGIIILGARLLRKYISLGLYFVHDPKQDTDQITRIINLCEFRPEDLKDPSLPIDTRASPGAPESSKVNKTWTFKRLQPLADWNRQNRLHTRLCRFLPGSVTLAEAIFDNSCDTAKANWMARKLEEVKISHAEKVETLHHSYSTAMKKISENYGLIVEALQEREGAIERLEEDKKSKRREEVTSELGEASGSGACSSISPAAPAAKELKKFIPSWSQDEGKIKSIVEEELLKLKRENPERFFTYRGDSDRRESVPETEGSGSLAPRRQTLKEILRFEATAKKFFVGGLENESISKPSSPRLFYPISLPSIFNSTLDTLNSICTNSVSYVKRKISYSKKEEGTPEYERVKCDLADSKGSKEEGRKKEKTLSPTFLSQYLEWLKTQKRENQEQLETTIRLYRKSLQINTDEFFKNVLKASINMNVGKKEIPEHIKTREIKGGIRWTYLLSIEADEELESFSTKPVRVGGQEVQSFRTGKQRLDKGVIQVILKPKDYYNENELKRYLRLLEGSKKVFEQALDGRYFKSSKGDNARVDSTIFRDEFYISFMRTPRSPWSKIKTKNKDILKKLKAYLANPSLSQSQKKPEVEEINVLLSAIMGKNTIKGLFYDALKVLEVIGVNPKQRYYKNEFLSLSWGEATRKFSKDPEVKTLMEHVTECRDLPEKIRSKEVDLRMRTLRMILRYDGTGGMGQETWGDISAAQEELDHLKKHHKELILKNLTQITSPSITETAMLKFKETAMLKFAGLKRTVPKRRKGSEAVKLGSFFEDFGPYFSKLDKMSDIIFYSSSVPETKQSITNIHLHLKELLEQDLLEFTKLHYFISEIISVYNDDKSLPLDLKQKALQEHKTLQEMIPSQWITTEPQVKEEENPPEPQGFLFWSYMYQNMRDLIPVRRKEVRGPVKPEIVSVNLRDVRIPIKFKKGDRSNIEVSHERHKSYYGNMGQYFLTKAESLSRIIDSRARASVGGISRTERGLDQEEDSEAEESSSR